MEDDIIFLKLVSVKGDSSAFGKLSFFVVSSDGLCTNVVLLKSAVKAF